MVCCESLTWPRCLKMTKKRVRMGTSQRKRKKKENILSKKSKNDPNAPIATRMPFPEMKDSDKLEKAKAIRESFKRANLGPDNIPSICMYRYKFQ